MSQSEKKKFGVGVKRKIKERIDLKRLLFRIFDEPKPRYISKVTIIDRVLDVCFLWAIPDFVKPNYVTIFRFISIPFIIYLILAGYYNIGIVLFVVSAVSDAVDGALARTRNHITDWGIVFDPFADKLLIGIVGGIMIYRFISPVLAFVIIILELILIFSSYFRFKGKIVPAKTVGKVKMTLQCVGVSLIFLFLVVGAPIILTIATYVLYLGVFFALLSISIYRSI